MMENQIILEVNGVQYSGFTDISVMSSIEAISSTFSFGVSATSPIVNFPIKNGSSCRVLIGSIPIIHGYVENIEISYNSKIHKITVSGRDKTCDIIDSTLGKGMSFNAGVTLEDIANKVFSYLGITDVKAYSIAGVLDPFSKGEIVASETGESCFEFLAKYAKKRSVLITTDGNGNVVFARTSTNTINTILNLSYTNQSTILEATASYDNTKRFYKYILNVQDNLSGMAGDDVLQNFDFKAKSVVNKQSISYDEGARRTRVLNLMQHEQASPNDKDFQNKAVWECNIRRSKDFQYIATVQGFIPINDQDKIWRTNLLVEVNDEFSDISNPSNKLLIKSVQYNYNLQDGSKTTLTLVRPESYTVDIIQGIRFKNKIVKQGAGKDITTHF